MVLLLRELWRELLTTARKTAPTPTPVVRRHGRIGAAVVVSSVSRKLSHTFAVVMLMVSASDYCVIVHRTVDVNVKEDFDPIFFVRIWTTGAIDAICAAHDVVGAVSNPKKIVEHLTARMPDIPVVFERTSPTIDVTNMDLARSS